MKRNMEIIFLVLVSVISVQGIAFANAKENEIKNCGTGITIAECLQDVIEEDNALAKENLALKKDIKELQNKLKNLEGQNLADLADAIKHLQKEQEEIKKQLSVLLTQFQSHKHGITMDIAGGHYHGGGSAPSEHRHNAAAGGPIY